VYRPANHWHFIAVVLDTELKEYSLNGAEESKGVPEQGNEDMCAAYALVHQEEAFRVFHECD